MKCPHCKVGIAELYRRTPVFDFMQTTLLEGKVIQQEIWTALHQRCPECYEVIIQLEKIVPGVGKTTYVGHPHVNLGARDIPPEVAAPYRDDFKEACLVLPLSAKASAALSRRCLQAVLREKGQTKKKDLADQIDEVINAKTVPAYIAEELHAVRNIGNFGAHPMKSTNTGAIIDVEPGEAEWNLDVLESVFDFYFVQPELAAKRKAELNKKLKEAGKPELK
jgi:hypothetical protein